MRRQHRRNQGFTLIELSIVLVVVGLIVGGVLVGQNLIKAAQTRAQLAQIEK
jgi:prepilin-type N-terminal cleavage/methylation domain-containing protein